MPLINCEVSLMLTWSSTCFITNCDEGKFEITDTKLYVPVVTLSTQDNAKLLEQLGCGFKRAINWNKYLSKPELLARNPNLNHLLEPSFQGVNGLFVLAFVLANTRIYFILEEAKETILNLAKGTVKVLLYNNF